MVQEDSVDELMARLQAGDADAAEVLFARFARRLIGLARNRLDSRMRQKVDPEDVMQSVFRSFFRRQANDEYDVSDWDSLWYLLARITMSKCGHQIEHWRRGKRDVQCEAPPPLSGEESGIWCQIVSREPTPSEALVLTETLEQVMRGLDDHQRQIIEQRLLGKEVAEISAAVGYTRRTVQRALKLVGERLKSMLVES